MTDILRERDGEEALRLSMIQVVEEWVYEKLSAIEANPRIFRHFCELDKNNENIESFAISFKLRINAKL
jgi:hypothetical protein